MDNLDSDTSCYNTIYTDTTCWKSFMKNIDPHVQDHNVVIDATREKRKENRIKDIINRAYNVSL